MTESTQAAIERIKSFVHGSWNPIWEDLCAAKQPTIKQSLVDDLGIKCTYDQRVKIQVAVRPEFQQRFGEITVATPSSNDRAKERTWYEYQENGFWTDEKYREIIDIVRRVADQVVQASGS